MSDIVKQGYVKFQTKNLGVWKKRWIILRMKSSGGPVRLEKYKDETAALMTAGAERRIIDLTRVASIDRLPDSIKRQAIGICVDNFETVQFCTDSEMEAEAWLSAIRGEIAASGRMQDVFQVYLMKNPKLGTHGDCTMQITPDQIRLLDHRKNEIVAWPLNKLRRYGVERSMFTIEAGRSCPTGEGIFVFDCQDAESLYQRVHDLTKSLAQAQRSGGNPMMTSGDRQTNADNYNNSNREGGASRGGGGASWNGAGASGSREFSQSNWRNTASMNQLSQPDSGMKSKENDYSGYKPRGGGQSKSGSDQYGMYQGSEHYGSGGQYGGGRAYGTGGDNYGVGSNNGGYYSSRTASSSSSGGGDSRSPPSGGGYYAAEKNSKKKKVPTATLR